MTPWYEEAVFYHIYPIGMTGAPRENREEQVVHRFTGWTMASSCGRTGMHGDLYWSSF